MACDEPEWAPHHALFEDDIMYKPKNKFFMRKITAIICLLVAIIANAQYSNPGFYRVHSANSDAYICIKGTHYEASTKPDAFWPCILMLTDSAQVSDPGSIIYIPRLEQTSLYAQGVSTYSLTGLWMEVDTAKAREGDRETYIATTEVMIQDRPFKCFFRDEGFGLTAGSSDKKESRWWIEPVNEESMETSFLGVKPQSEAMVDSEGWYWTTTCCDFPMLLPQEGGVEGAYTIKNVEMGEDGKYYAVPVKTYGQGDIIPAATPVLLKCKAAYASGNKVVPVGDIANNTDFPLQNDLLQGGYFSIFTNYCALNPPATTDYIPEQAIMASATNLALGVDADGVLGFFPKEEGTYMDANTAWLNVEGMELEGVAAVYLNTTAQEEEFILGDVNGDNLLDVGDVAFLIDYLLGVEPDNDQTGMRRNPADIDGNGIVDLKDLTILIDMLL